MSFIEKMFGMQLNPQKSTEEQNAKTYEDQENRMGQRVSEKVNEFEISYLPALENKGWMFVLKKDDNTYMEYYVTTRDEATALFSLTKGIAEKNNNYFSIADELEKKGYKPEFNM